MSLGTLRWTTWNRIGKPLSSSAYNACYR
jgi:hypothetical protein